tara:strand:+ start:789 stop:1493 length:705 start_codon:yes stop_codon:yes gene_type:complete
MPVTQINSTREATAYALYFPDWFSARDSLNATSIQNHSGGTIGSAFLVNWQVGRSGPDYSVARSYFYFDLTTISGTITAIDLYIRAQNGGLNNINVAINGNGLAFGGNGSSAFTSGEFDINGGMQNDYINSQGVAWSAGSYQQFSLNTNAIADATNNQFLILQVIDFDFDYLNNDPTPLGPISINGGFQAFFPNYLSVTTTAAGYPNNVMGVTSANIDNVIGIATANIDNVIGV